MRDLRLQRNILRGILGVLIAAAVPATLSAQGPTHYSGRDLDDMITRIALYPDPLIAQILAAATYPDQIQDAARWSDEHHYLHGDYLARAITEDHLPFDPSVQSLLPFPSVMEMMASDMNWTAALGNAFLSQQDDVMESVQRMRRRARGYGYLHSNSAVIVSDGPYISIMPARADYVVVPVYDPHVVFVEPRHGFVVDAAIGFGFGVAVGYAFRPWGWGESHFAWDRHEVYVGHDRWGRNWNNRAVYVHPYHGVERWNGPAHPVEEHQRIQRDEYERNAPRRGYERHEDHPAPRHDDHHDNGHHDDHGHH